MSLFDYPGTATDSKTISEITLLADLGKDDWARVLNLVETRQSRAGEDLIHAGDKDDSFCIITGGTVDVVVNREGGERVLASIKEGSVFGEIAFFDGLPRSATIRARTVGTAIRVSRESFEKLSAWEPKIARQLLFDLGCILTMRLRATTSRA